MQTPLQMIPQGHIQATAKDASPFKTERLWCGSLSQYLMHEYVSSVCQTQHMSLSSKISPYCPLFPHLSLRRQPNKHSKALPGKLVHHLHDVVRRQDCQQVSCYYCTSYQPRACARQPKQTGKACRAAPASRWTCRSCAQTCLRNSNM